MKKLLFLITVLSLSIVSCKKEKIEYEVECVAYHRWTDVNEWGIGMGYGFYGFSLNDEDYNTYWEKSGTVQDETLTFKTTAKSGDYITLFVGVYDTWDFCSLEVKVDGQSVAYVSEDNQFMNDGTSYEFKTINGKKYLTKEFKIP